MAEIAVSGLIKVTLERLSSPIIEQLWLLWGLGKDIEELTDTLSIIMGVLSDAEEKQQKNMAVKSWLKQLKKVAYDAADILDECKTEALRRKLETEGRVTEKVREFFSAFNPVKFSFLMAHKIKKIRERLDAIAGKRLQLGLKESDLPVIETKARAPEKTDSFINESSVYGREEDKEKVVELLLNADNDKEVSVIPVVGMAGLGKTTLAQWVYNDARVEGHFNLKIWVCVSDDFDVGRLTKAILENATARKYDDEDVDVMQRRLRGHLSGKKFFLVLDDVWDDNQDNWERLKGFLQAGAVGSKIIVTTRSKKVASIMGTLPSHCLTRMSDDDCWSIFKQRAFRQGREDNPNLVNIGKEIAKKCNGVPLIAKALGGLMHFKTEESQWQSIKENEIWNVLKDDDRTLHALRLSYYHLSPQLKQCFAFCSVFPKDHKICKDELVHLWMAEGFIQPSEGSRQMEEEIGREYFDELLWRSFFQDAKKDDDGNVVSCKMHDLMHDLAELVSEDARSIVTEDGKITIPDGCRHLSVKISRWKSGSITLMPSNKAKKLRTLLLLQSGYVMVSHELFTHLPCLRALDISNAIAMKGALNSIGGLKKLRYLYLRLGGVRILPNSFSKLHNMQTLKLTYCRDLKKLPRVMGKMINLRHLQITDWRSLTHMPAMGELKFLQMLSVFVVGEESECNIRELKDLNLGGELNIRKLENVRGGGNAQEAKLSEKANIRSLELSWGYSPRRTAHSADLSEQILEGLQPHPNLRRMKVENYGGKRLAHWMGGSFLHNLVRLSLYCSQCEKLPSLGQLPLLKYLYLSKMDGVKCIGSDFYGDRAFPSLEELSLESMANLEEWSGCNGRQAVVLPHLKRLQVLGCPKLSVVPCFPSLSSLEEVTLRHIANLEEWSGHNGGEAVLPRLKRLVVSGCPKLSVVSCFPLLFSLTLSGFEAESLPNCFFQNPLSHVSKLEIFHSQNLQSWDLGNVTATLEELHISFCPKLVSLFPEEMQNHSPRLRRLKIWKCDGLMSLRLQSLASLIDLTIGSCKNLASFMGGMHHLTALQRLDITECPELLGSSLADGAEHLTSLTHLHIISCAKATHLPEGLIHATCLQSLYIRDLPYLSALPGWIGNLSSLQGLHINECRNLESLPFGFQHLTNLQTLEISGCPNLVSLPSEFQHLTNLRHLNIWDCPNLVSLPSGFQHLANLRELEIRHCRNLVSLPSGFQHLTNLQTLEIVGCHPELEKRCKKERGEDWHKISHIQKIRIRSVGPERQRHGRPVELKSGCFNALIPTSCVRRRWKNR